MIKIFLTVNSCHRSRSQLGVTILILGMWSDTFKAFLKIIADQYRDVIRLSICSWATTERDVSLSVKSFVEARNLAEGKA